MVEGVQYKLTLLSFFLIPIPFAFNFKSCISGGGGGFGVINSTRILLFFLLLVFSAVQLRGLSSDSPTLDRTTETGFPLATSAVLL